MSEWIKPYGDTLDDGIVQISFTLPVENSARARKAAEAYLEKLNLEEPTIAHAKKISEGFTFFVCYAKASPRLDFARIEATEVQTKELSFYEINSLIKDKLGRRLVVAGATIGSDAHTVGIDAIMNMKGYNQDYGLERYAEVEAHNLGSQVPADELLKQALDFKADAILVSQTVTQKDAHLKNFTEFVELLEAEGLRDQYILLAGGPRVTNDLAIELGYDAGFGPGTVPSQVAAFIITRILEKQGIAV
jgi:beta-lysine 5,6-aminomutase beta subunit